MWRTRGRSAGKARDSIYKSANLRPKVRSLSDVKIDGQGHMLSREASEINREARNNSELRLGIEKIVEKTNLYNRPLSHLITTPLDV